MNRVAPHIIAVYSYVYAMKGRAHIDSNDREASSKLATSMLFFLPPAAALTLLITLLGLSLGHDEIQGLLAIVAIATFFGTGAYTDRIHDRNVSEIKELAYQICEDPERGENWAKRRLVIAFAVQFALTIAIVALGRAYVVFGTDSPFLAI